MNDPKLQQFIKKNSHYFWYIPEKDKPNLSLNTVVEFILSFGDENNIKELFDIVGVSRVAQIFRQQISQKRINYKPQTAHFFTDYFARHAQTNS